MTEVAVLSLGIAAAVGPDVAAKLAPLVEEAGFHTLWVNDTPGADALAVLAAAARTTTRLTLATGVIPVDRRHATEIAAEVHSLDLPQDRLVLGIGSGQARSGVLALVEDSTATLREALSSRVMVGALGPKMRKLAAEKSDGVLLNWLTPATAREQAIEAHSQSVNAHVALYVRSAFDPAARDRLHEETARYASYPTYAANFAREGARAEDTVWDGTDAADAAGAGGAGLLADYRSAVDEVVLRAITPHDEFEDYVDFVEAVRARA